MERVLATARSMQLRERGRVAEALAASLRDAAALEEHAVARGHQRGGSETALHFMFYCPQAPPPPAPPRPFPRDPSRGPPAVP